MSVSSISLNSDERERYRRLAEQYGKVREYVKVLKRGVVVEREKNEKLSEELKMRDARIRQLENEHESLTFRNEQLLRRVENLQEEVEKKVDGKKEKSSKKSTAVPKDALNQIQSMTMKIELLEEELALKLRQNEELVSQLSENEQSRGEEMAQMSAKFAKEVRLLEETVETLQKSEKNGENMKKSVEIEKKEEKIEEKEEIVRSKTPINMDEAYLMVVETSKNVFEGFHKVFNLLQQRTEIYPYDVTMEMLPKNVEKLSSEYSQCSLLFNDSSNLIDSMLEKSSIEIEEDIPKLLEKLEKLSRKFEDPLKNLIGLMRMEENRVTWCNGQLANLNDQWMLAICQFFTAIEAIISSAKAWKNGRSLLEDAVGGVATSCTNLADIFSERWEIESNLPTTTKRMRCVGEALKGALGLQACEMMKLAARVRQVERMMTSSEEQQVLQEEEEEEEMKTPVQKKAPNNPFENLEEEKECEKCRKMGEVIEKEGEKKKVDEEKMQKEIEILNSKLREVHQEKEKITIDFMLIKRKLELANGNEKYNIADYEQIREIGKERVQEMMKKLEKAESAARYFKKECELLILLQIDGKEREEKLNQQIFKIENLKTNLEEELEACRKGYETQIGELSDHVATLMKKEQEEGEEKKKEPLARTNRSSIKSFFKS